MTKVMKAEYDYDFKYDILFLLAKKRVYDHSVEVSGSVVVDFDTKGHVTGIQIFDASDFFKISKETIQNILRLRFEAHTHDNVIDIRISIKAKNHKGIVERNPVLTQSIQESHFKDTQTICEMG